MKEGVMKIVFLLAACVSILAVALICIFLFANGVPAIHKIGITEFLFGQTWKPSNNIYGIFPMIIGSIYVTAGAVIIGVPMGILCAIFLARFCPEKLYKIVKPAVSLLAGIPSIVYGFFGLVVIVPIMQDLTGTNGKGILTASILLGIMILPTVIGVSESAIRAVPNSYYEGSLALGKKRILRSAACSKAGDFGRCYLRCWSCHWGNHGSYHGCRQQRGNAKEHLQRRTYINSKYRYGNGLRNRPASRGTAGYRRGSVRIYFDY